MSDKQPPYDFEGVLSRADSGALGNLLRPEARRLIQQLDPTLYYPANLSRLILGLRPASELLGDQNAREMLLDLLRPNEAHALVSHLGLNLTDAPYDVLKGVTFSKSLRSKLLAFFGIAEPIVEVPEVAPSLQTVEPGYALFPHQVEVLSRARKVLSVSPRRLLLHMPTGAGKTRTAMNLVAEFLRMSPDRLVIWLAHSEELCNQAADEFSKAWENIGNLPAKMQRFWGSYEIDLGSVQSGILIAGLPKMVARVKSNPVVLTQLAVKKPFVVLDEAHQAVAPTYQLLLSVLIEANDGTSLLGLSATPGRTWNDIDADEALASFFARHKEGLRIPGFSNPVTYLMSEGYLAKVTFRRLMSGANVQLTDSEKQELETALELPMSVLETLALSEQRNLQIIAETESLCKRHRRIILFAASVGQSDLLATVLRGRGIRAQSVTSKQSNEQRKAVIEEFKTSEDDAPFVLCNYGILTTGFDAPKTSAALVARPTLSLVLYSQMIGRAIRGPKAGGNADAEIVTVIDTGLPGFASVEGAFANWEDVWEESK
jgi:superfamily II DNA or RNA helicase